MTNPERQTDRERLGTPAPLGASLGHFSERAVLTPAQRYFSCLWIHSVPADAIGAITIVPDACIDLQWIDGVVRIAGPDQQALIESVQPGATVIGFRFQPAAAAAWLGLPMSELTGLRVPLDELNREEARIFSDAIGDAVSPEIVATRMAAVIDCRARHKSRPDRALAAAYRWIGVDMNAEPLDTNELAKRIGISTRTLRRQCQHSFGYGAATLSRILRLQRFMSVAREYGAHNLATAAAHSGYYDQSHLNRELAQLVGMTPRALRMQLRVGHTP